jgi:hypothetical protein
MTLIVNVPAGYDAERRYIIDVVLGDWLGLKAQMTAAGSEDVSISLAGDQSGRRLTVPDRLFATPATAWLTEAVIPAVPLPRVEVPAGWLPPDASAAVPVLFGDLAQDRFLVTSSDGMRLSVDLFGGIFFQLTRFEELVASVRDEHDRVPTGSLIAIRDGFPRVALADAYTELLWSALVRLWPELKRQPRRYRVAPTHDVDLPLSRLFRSPWFLLRTTAGDLALRRDPGLAARRIVTHLGGPAKRDPWRTFPFLMSTSERHGLVSDFYFLVDRKGPTDGRYDVEDAWVQELMVSIRERGHDVGFHGGYTTYVDAEATRSDFERLRHAAVKAGFDPGKRWAGRQHFLLWRNPDTWVAWDVAGIDVDSTMGFAETVGFRSGTSHEHALFDLRARRQLRLRERPLLAMDTSLFLYERASLPRATDLILEVGRETQRYGGTFTGLWHNNAVASRRHQRWYEDVVAALVALG